MNKLQMLVLSVVVTMLTSCGIKIGNGASTFHCSHISENTERDTCHNAVGEFNHNLRERTELVKIEEKKNKEVLDFKSKERKEKAKEKKSFNDESSESKYF